MMADCEHKPSPKMQGREVYKWPEFRALAKRLGVDLDNKDNPIVDITLHLESGGMTSIIIKTLGRDFGSETKEE